MLQRPREHLRAGRHHCPPSRAGFSLLELSVVIIIIATVTGATLAMGVSSLESARRAQTANKIMMIEDALMAYRTVYKRLPCPADAALAESDANYGVEGANQGSCRNGTPAANFLDATNFVVEGAVPVKTLSLPDQFMYDGWDRKFAYAVQQKMTSGPTPADVEAFTMAPINEACGMITVRSTSGASPALSSGATYSLVSFGSTGHGAFLRSGSRYNTGSADADELINCHCNSSGVATAYSASYIQKDETSTFDDVVRYKERWQMQTARLDNQAANYDGPELAVAHSTTPYVSIYSHACDSFSKIPNPPTLPAGAGMGASFSASNTYLAVAHAGLPFVTIYLRSDQSFSRQADPATLPTGQGNGVAWSPDTSDTYLAVAHVNAPFVSIYKVTSGPTFTKQANPATVPTGQGNGVAFAPNGNYLAVAHNTSPYLSVYKISAGTFTKIANPATLPASNGKGVAFSPVFYVGTIGYLYVAVANANNPYVTIYKLNTSTDVLTKLADPATLPAGTGNGVAFSPDGKYLAVAHAGSPYVTIYSITTSTDTFTKIANPGTLPSNDAYGVAFSFDSRYMAVTGYLVAVTYLNIYRFNSATDTFVKLTDPATLPVGNSVGVGFRNGPP